MNLQLTYMQRALRDVQGVQHDGSDEVQKRYGALCHQVPVFVLTHGLAITAAFVDAKARAEGNGGPYRRMQRHLVTILDGGAQHQSLAAVLAGRTDTEYMLDTFTILDAWIYYKRFAVSILGVEAGDVDMIADAPDTSLSQQPATTTGER